MSENLINAEQLQDLCGSKNLLIVDCRFDLMDVDKGQAAFEQSHIPGAVYAHLDHHLSSAVTAESGRHPLPDTHKLVGWLAACGMTEQTRVVAYDDSQGAMASRLWWLLKCLGHDDVALLDGGWQAWVSRGMPVSAERKVVIPSDFQADFSEDCVISTRKVEQNLVRQIFQLIDVRTPQRFSGLAEPIDPVAGHIPGAINMPLGDNLDDSGFFKPPHQLRILYNDINVNWPSENQVFMCGSGVTACHSVFALVLAGYPLARVYAGSWSEWIRDPKRAVETGED